MALILGLDLGTSSIGWALIEDKDSLPQRIVAAGVRIFPEGMDRTKGEKSLNQDRRDARSLRRQGYRRARRKQKLLNALVDISLLPANQKERDQLFSHTNPYALRTKALDHELEAYELGRALYHLGQRRGYLSNRKTGTEKDGAVAAGIGEIDKAMQEGNFRTLGEFLNNLDPHANRRRDRYTSRQMYLNEFEAIWRTQEQYHPKALNIANKVRIRDAIFYQRPLKIQRHLIGECEFEPGRKRAAKGSLAAQEFRLWTDINHLKLLFPDGGERFLTDEERITLYEKLATTKQLTWERVKKLLGQLESTRFAQERIRKSGIKGNETAAIIRSQLKKDWDRLGERDQESLVNDLLNMGSETALNRRLIRHWKLDPELAQKLMDKTLGLPRGHLHLSQKAARNITKHLKTVASQENRGLTYSQACEMAGYEHTKTIQRGSHKILPFPGKPSKHDKDFSPSQVKTSDLRNPLVERALFQIRKVVNAIIREYGKPDAVRIELARDLKRNAKERETLDQQNKANQERNEKAREALIENHGIPNPTRTDIIKYNLWQECDHQCPYTGRMINADALFGSHPQFDIEHIIPYQRCLDDSYMNKTLCEAEFNRSRKGRLTPAEVFAEDSEEYAAVLQRAQKLPRPKFKRFSLNAIDDLGEFVSQQLNETRYISRKAAEYLKQLDLDVRTLKGNTTAILRRVWGMNNLLSDDGEKNRLDHRHHAVDAIVIALTSQRNVQQLARYAETGGDRLRFDDAKPPINNLRQQAQEIVESIIVSHKSQRKIKGPLHEETLYGATEEQDPKGNDLIVLRRNISSLSAKDLSNIRDSKIREMAIAHLNAHDGNIKKAFAQEPTTFGFQSQKGEFIPIRKVRVCQPLNTEKIGHDQTVRHIKTGSNHHIEIFSTTTKSGKTKFDGEVITTLQAITRQTTDDPVINTTRENGQHFVMALHINDMLELSHNGKRSIWFVQKIGQNKQIFFRHHSDATEKKDMSLAISKRPGSLMKCDPIKLQLSPIGKVVPIRA